MAQTYVVRSGDTLSDIALHFYGDGSEQAWRRIYNVPHNRHVIGSDPNLIKPGQLLFIPLPHPIPPNHQYTVRPGDTLSEIALHFYGDGSQASWEKIYNVPQNKQTIGSDPDLIKPGQVLIIPPS
jgi:nucleoid-associated protein YgaU